MYHLTYNSEADAPRPLLLREYLRAWRVAKEELPRLSFGAHWSHSDSMAFSQLFGAHRRSKGLASMLSSSSCRNPRYMPISLHSCAWPSSLLRRQGKSDSVRCLWSLSAVTVGVLSTQSTWRGVSSPHFFLFRVHVQYPISGLAVAMWASHTPQGQSRAGLGLELE